MGRGHGAPVRVVLLTSQADQAAGLATAGADRIFCLEGQHCADDRALALALLPLVRQQQPLAVLCNATVRGRALMPMLAALLQTGLTADCTGLALLPDGTLLQQRPAMGDHITAEIRCRTRPQMATVRPGIFEGPADLFAPAPVERWPGGPSPQVVRTGFAPAQNTQSLTDAKVIFAGGVGLGSREGFDLLARLAAAAGGCVGATRAAVNAGFAPYAWQIGQTGAAVRPALYLAVGISGAVQHLVGMQNAGLVVAVNSDPRAPIFGYADYGVAAPWQEALAPLVERLQAGRLL